LAYADVELSLLKILEASAWRMAPNPTVDDEIAHSLGDRAARVEPERLVCAKQRLVHLAKSLEASRPRVVE
jgi:hypothetical protein